MTLSLSNHDTMWMLTHSPRGPPEHRFPSPTSSAYEVPVVTSRPATSTISALTLRQNERLEQRFAISSPLEFTRAIPIPQLEIRPKTTKNPSDRDFKRILDRLDKITSSQGTAYGRVNLKEGKPFDLTLDQSDRQHFRVFTRNNPCPLRISLKRTGKTVLYLSRTLMEPSEALYDLKTKGEKILVSDPGLKFRTESVFVTVIALEDCRFSIVATFGREILESGKLTIRKQTIHKDDTLKALDEIKKDEKRLTELYITVEEIEKKRKLAALTRSQSKDFIEINKAVQSPRPEIYREKLEQLAVRTSQARTLRAKNIEAKKDRALAMIYRREQLQEMARQAKLAAHAKLRKQESERKVLEILFLAVGMESLYSLLINGKKKALEEHLKTTAAIRIQYRIRRWYRHIDRSGLARRIASTALRQFHWQCGPLLRADLAHKVHRCVATSRTNHKLPLEFKTFYRRMTLIQQMWKWYQEKIKQRWVQINAGWAHALDLLKADSLRKKTPGKKGKAGKKKEDASALYNISPTAKQQVLSVYLQEQKKAYRQRMRSYLRDSELLLQMGAKAFLMRYATLDDDEFRAVTAAPDFKFMPSTDEMVRLVDAAIALSAQ